MPPLQRAVLHALELAAEDVQRWTAGLDGEEVERVVFGLPSVGFQMRHIARSLDRLLTYAEGGALTEGQHAELRSEHERSTGLDALRQEFEAALQRSAARVLALPEEALHAARGVGRAMLPSSVTGLLVHAAEHTQRHAGQLVTTAKLVLAMREAQQS